MSIIQIMFITDKYAIRNIKSHTKYEGNPVKMSWKESGNDFFYIIQGS